MPTVSTLGSPGVEVREFDGSLRTTNNAGTTVFIPGFASQGPVNEINPIGSMDDFISIYGQPTNAAERYFYYTVKAVIDNSGAGTTILTSRLSYGIGDGDDVSNAFTLLAYPAVPVIKNAENERGYDHHVIDNELASKLLVLTDGGKDDDEVAVSPIENSVISTMILNSEYANKKVSLTSIALPEGEYIPDTLSNAVTYKTKPILSYRIDGQKSEKDQTVLGSISIEQNGDEVTLHLAFPINFSEKEQCGIFTIDGKYSLADFKAASISEMTFKGDIVDAEASLVSAYEIGKYYSQPQGVSKEGADYSDVTYLVGSPTTFQLSLSEYYQLVTGELFDWSNESYLFHDIDNEKLVPKNDDKNFGMLNALKHSAFIAINPSRTIINDSFEGYYLAITDNIFNQAEDGYTYNAIKSLKITTLNSDQKGELNPENEGKGLLDYQFQTVNKARLDFHLDSNNKGSISQVIQNEIIDFNTSSAEYDDTLNMAVFKIKKSTTASEVMKLTYGLAESYNASFGKTRQYSVSNSTDPKSYFVENIIEDSLNLSIIVNPYIADNIYVDVDNNLCGKVRVFSTKLLSSLERYERKYLTKKLSDPTANNANKSLMSAIRLAQSNINSWTNVVKRAGVSLELIARNFLPSEGETESDFYTFTLSDSLYPFGTYTVPKTANKYIGTVPSKLERVLNTIANDEIYPDIDIMVEGGLGTIYAYSNTSDVLNEANSAINTVTEDGMTVGGVAEDGYENGRIFDDTIILNGIEDLRTGRSSLTEDAENVIEDWMAVQNVFLKVANSETNGGRGNTFYIGDVLRGILVKGKNTKISNLFGSKITNSSYDDEDSVNHSWATSIYYPIKHLTDSFVSSFCSIYNQYFKILDGFSGEKMWVPASGFVAGRMCAVDQSTGPWEAAAGLNRGMVPGVLDTAVNPSLSQRSDLYKICINSIPNLPNVGPTIWGIRTMSKKASAFDQNTCRRTFLYIEKVIKQTLRYFIFERNDSYTQLQVVNELEPFLDSLKKARAIYSYRLICDATNNTEEIVNNGDMVVDVAAAPERTAENIILNVTANRWSQQVESSISSN